MSGVKPTVISVQIEPGAAASAGAGGLETAASPMALPGDGDYIDSQSRLKVGPTKIPVARSLSNKSSSVGKEVPSCAGGKELRSQQQQQQQAKGKKLGHRRVGGDGEVTYKKFTTSQLMGSIQLGLQHSVGRLANTPDRDLLTKDFYTIESVSFTRDGAVDKTPAHNYSEFRFRTVASFAFKKFREMFLIGEGDFLVSLCQAPMRELSNPGVSGSIFYLTQDDKFILKTVQHKENGFLTKLLPGYYMNLTQNPRTLLPKFFGLYCYSSNAKNVRIVVMNNLLPSDLKMHARFDLKGSTYKRKASRRERSKASPTFKDLDFMAMYPEGILLQHDLHENLMNTIQRDCRVLESFRIMDYSLLIGVHNVDLAAREAAEQSADEGASGSGDDEAAAASDNDEPPAFSFERQGSRIYQDGQRPMIAHSSALESITMEAGNQDVEQADVVPAPALPPPSAPASASAASAASPVSNLNTSGTSATLPASFGASRRFTGTDESDGIVHNVWGGIPAKNHRGENLLLFIGIIDILQAYGVLKKAEHYWKSIVHDGDTVSVHRPNFYARRFQAFMGEKVFRKMPAPHPLRSSLHASFRRSQYRRTLSKEGDMAAMASQAAAVAGTSSGVAAASASSSSPLTAGALPPSAQQRRLWSQQDEDVGDGRPPPQRGVKDPNAPSSPSAVTVITIGDEVHLPAVLQDRRQRTASEVSSGSATGQVAAANATDVPPAAASSKFPPASVPAPPLPSSAYRKVSDQADSPPPTSGLTEIRRTSPVGAPSTSHGGDERLETGSIITMTSDERVQIYVPSPQTTPYNTITKQQTQTPVNIRQWTAATAEAGYRSYTPLNMSTSADESATPSTAATMVPAAEASLEMVQISMVTTTVSASTNKYEEISTKRDVTSASSSLDQRTLMDDLPSLPSDAQQQQQQRQPLSLSDIQLMDEDEATASEETS